MSSSASSTTANVSWLPARSWQHFVAGGIGGMCGAVVTSPFDVVKTRLQSSMFRDTAVQVQVQAKGTGEIVAQRAGGGLLYHFVETGHILRDIYKYEGVSALFKGLGPTLVGVIPARSINFFTYGNGKQVIATNFNNGQENSWVHLSAATVAGIVTGTATNPIWVVKTRMQLSVSQSRPYINSWECIKDILRTEGVKGMYKGLTASYLGVTEGTIQWTLYERMKRLTSNLEGEGGAKGWVGMLASAGVAKAVASMITYPHEVIRTRLRQPKIDGVVKYTGLYQTLRLIIAEEGVKRLYGGLSAHLLRVIPNAAVMFSIYEGFLWWCKG